LRYRPALRTAALAWAYEPIAMRLCRAAVWRPAVVEAVAPQPGEKIVDLGAGPGTLCRLIERRCPGATVVGLDPDPVMVARGRHLAAQEGSRVAFVRASATALPLAGRVDVCVSSLMFHHLERDAKRAALAEALRVLRPGGRLVVADWGPPRTRAGRAAFAVTQAFDGFAITRDHADGGFVAMLPASGLAEVTERARWPTPVGTLCLYTGRKPASAEALKKARMSAAT